MGIELRTHKMLWGRSGNICAFPGCMKELVADISESDGISVVGVEAHMVAQKTTGSRGESPLSPKERDEYGNLILLCSEHHKIIDDHPDTYSIDILQKYKKDHENFVKNNLNYDAAKQRDDEVYASYIDEFMILASIENYTYWTTSLFSSNGPTLSKTIYENFKKMVIFIPSRIWDNRYPLLEMAFNNFNSVLEDLLFIFDKYSEEVGISETLCTTRFYKIKGWDKVLYHKLLDKYYFHVELVGDLTLELIRAANYVFDKVREYLIPSFRIKEGVLLNEVWHNQENKTRLSKIEYKAEERISNPYPGLRKFMEIRNDRDFSLGTGVSNDYLPHTF